MMHEKTDIEQCIWEVEDIQKIFLLSVKAGLSRWCCCEGCSCPSLGSWLHVFFAMISAHAQLADLAEH